MGKYKTIITLGVIASLVSFMLLFKNKKMKNYVLIGLGSLVVGVLLGFILDKPQTKYLAGEVKTEYRDTCVESKLICTLTTKDSLAIYRYIREGFKTKSEKVVAKVEEVKVPTEEQKQKPLMERKYTKILNNGMITVWDTLTVLGTIEDWDRAYKINEVVEVQEKSTTTTAIVEAGTKTDVTETIKYIPIETTSNSLFLGPSAGFQYIDGVNYQVGLNLSSNRFGFTVFTNPVELKQVGVKLDAKLFKVKK